MYRYMYQHKCYTKYDCHYNMLLRFHKKKHNSCSYNLINNIAAVNTRGIVNVLKVCPIYECQILMWQNEFRLHV